MKKSLFILIASLFLGGSIFAQHTSHWSYFNLNDFEQHGAVALAVSIDGTTILDSDNYSDYEVGFFVDTVCRGHGFLTYYAGDPCPMTDLAGIYYNPDSDNAAVVSFKLYDHVNAHEYTICTPSSTVVTGLDYMDFDNPIILAFSTPTLTLPIDGYDDNEDPSNYYLIATPINTVHPSNVTNMVNEAGTYDLYYFDQAQELEWINFKAGDGNYNLVPGKGYLYANKNTVELTFRGFPYEGTNEVTLDKNLGNNPNGAFEGWNLVGNPFNETVVIEDGRDFYVMNGLGSNVTTSENERIDAMQGIFVMANSDQEIMKFVPATSAKRATKNRVIVNLNNENGVLVDRAIVRLNEGNQLPKFQLNESSTTIFIPQNGMNYAVATINEEGQMPINFKPTKNENYTLVVTPESSDVEYLHLIDNLTGADIDLLTNSKYNFSANTTDFTSRFILCFRDNSNVDVNEMFSPLTYRMDGTLSINGVQGESEIQVVDMLGRVVSSENVNINGDIVRQINTPPGVYVVRLINNNNIYTQKIVVE